MVKMSLELSVGDMIRIFGSAVVAVEEGSASILGATLTSGAIFTIPEFKSYVLKSLANSRILISLEKNARVEVAVPEEEPYNEWVEVADAIIGGCLKGCTTLILGPTDAGKSSFAALLANRSLSLGLKPAIIDADVGQADLGPPGFIGLAMPSSYVSWLRDLKPVMLRFIGSIEPSPLIGKIISSCTELKMKALESGADIIIVSSDGWIEGWSALEYKLDLARSIDATHIVVIGSDELAMFMARSIHGNVYRLPRPMVQALRSPEDRRRIRQDNYRRFLEGDIIEINLDDIAVQGACISGKPVSRSVEEFISELLGTTLLEVLEYPGGLCLYLNEEKSIQPQSLKELQKRVQGKEILTIVIEPEMRILAALRDINNYDCPALLLNVDLEKRKAVFQTKCRGPFKTVFFSRIKLTRDYREASRGRIVI